MQTQYFSTLSDDFINDLATFDWSWETGWDWFIGMVSFQASVHGVLAYLIIGFSIITILLHLDATKGFTTLIIATIYRQTIGTIFNGAAVLIGVFGIYTKNIFVAKLRATFLTIRDLMNDK